MYRIKSLKKKDPIADKPFDKIQYLLTICQETLRKPEIRGHFFNLTKGSQHGLFRPAAETNAHGAPRDTRRQHRPRKASRREPARQSPERHAPRQEGRETFPTHKRLHGLTSPRVAGTWRNRGSAARPAGGAQRRELSEERFGGNERLSTTAGNASCSGTERWGCLRMR